MLLSLENRNDSNVLLLGKHTEVEISPSHVRHGLSLCFSFITNECY